LKKRIDRLLVERGLAETREKAQALIMAGLVLVDKQPATKAGMPVADTVSIQLKESGSPYVGRGGLKLEGAAKAFGLDPAGCTCVDIGSSTGGFTQFLLMAGAARVYAVDVDVKQLDWRVRQDARVVPVEKNARFLELTDIGELSDIVTIDVSFISLTMILPRIPAILKPGGRCIALVKPQFEVGRERVGKGGIVKDEADQHAAIEKCIQAGEAVGLKFVAQSESPITGREGNREFFIQFAGQRVPS
jgi:23S rRNA (cytidine1920-2'-O)/16S rRNA (cytidine1409-2'-O)-methyltransferase